ncbi:MAG: response regulator [Anaerolineaceae bacterium]|nr:response regulator [Anaerolineaceae bacterium]
MSKQENKQLILVVEDDDVLRRGIEDILHFEGYRTVGASDGIEAIDLAVREAPDLILLDIMMPRMNGYEVIKHVRSQSILQHIPIVILSAKSEKSDIAMGLELGADDYIAKPYDPVELLLRIEVRLHGHESLYRYKNQLDNLKPVFISYKRSDWGDFVKPLVARLEDEGFPFWVDKSSIEGSYDWLDEINKALKSAERMIVCVSPESLESRYVKMEYRYAFNNGIRLYPLICRPADLPAELQVLHYYNFTELDALVAALKKP